MQMKQEMAAQGEPVEPASVIPPAISDVENFALAPLWREMLGDDYRETKGSIYRGMHIRTQNSTAPKMPPADWRKGERTVLADWQGYFREVRAQVSVSGQTDVFPVPEHAGIPAADVLFALSRYDSQLAELREAARRPRSRFPLRYEDGVNMALPHLDYLQRASAFLRLRILAELDLGEADDALTDLQLGFRLQETIESEPTLISYLVRISMIETIVSAIWQGAVEHRWSDAQLTALDAQLRELDFLGDYERAFRAEAIWGVRTFDVLCASRDARLAFGLSYGNESVSGWKKAFRWMPAGWFEQNKITFVRQLRELRLLRAQPSADYIDVVRCNEHIAKLNASFSNRTPYDFMSVSMGSFGELSIRAAETIAHIRLARTACALERHWLAHGEFPETLGVLAPGFTDAVPKDIIDGGDLKYRRGTAGGFVLYSPGWNVVDDGGSAGLLRNNYDRRQGDWVWLAPA